ncbi:TPA: hypothetical protein TVQ94_000647 [Streptococcus equi subsp. zooepidemicus]|nr:hypothetical protein [Streptococcus equi subsp. zooepidemicus]
MLIKKKTKQNYGEKDELCRFSLPTAMLKSSLRKNVIKNNHSITKGEKNDNQKNRENKKDTQQSDACVIKP